MKRKSEPSSAGEDPSTWPVSRLKAFLTEKGVSFEGLTEKQELVACVKTALTASPSSPAAASSAEETNDGASSTKQKQTSAPLPASSPSSTSSAATASATAEAPIPPRSERTVDDWVTRVAPKLAFGSASFGAQDFAGDILYLRINAAKKVSSEGSDDALPLLPTIIKKIVLESPLMCPSVADAAYLEAVATKAKTGKPAGALFPPPLAPLGLRFLQQLAMGVDNGASLNRALKPKTGAAQKVCGKSLTSREVVFRCLECAADPTCIMCADCFQNSPCVNHEYRMTPSGGGMCDCGDPSAWKASSFCCKHGGASEKDDPSESVNPMDKAWIAAVLDGIALQCTLMVRFLIAYQPAGTPRQFNKKGNPCEKRCHEVFNTAFNLNRKASNDNDDGTAATEAKTKCYTKYTDYSTFRASSSQPHTGAESNYVDTIEVSLFKTVETLKGLTSLGEAATRMVFDAIAKEQTVYDFPPSPRDDSQAAAPTTSFLEEMVKADALDVGYYMMTSMNRGASLSPSWKNVLPFLKAVIPDMSCKLKVLRALVKYDELIRRPTDVTKGNAALYTDAKKDSLSSEAVQVLTVPWAAEQSIWPEKLALLGAGESSSRDSKTTSLHRLLSSLMYGLTDLNTPLTHPKLHNTIFSESSGSRHVLYKLHKKAEDTKYVILSPIHLIRYLTFASPLAGRMLVTSETLLRALVSVQSSAHISDIIRREEEGAGQHNYFAWDFHLMLGSLVKEVQRHLAIVNKNIKADSVDIIESLSENVLKALGIDSALISGDDAQREANRELLQALLASKKEQIESNTTEGGAAAKKKKKKDSASSSATATAGDKEEEEILPKGLQDLIASTRNFPRPPTDCVSQLDPIFQSQLDRCAADLRYPLLPARATNAVNRDDNMNNKTKSGLLPLSDRIAYNKALIAIIGSVLNEIAAVNNSVIAKNTVSVAIATAAAGAPTTSGSEPAKEASNQNKKDNSRKNNKSAQNDKKKSSVNVTDATATATAPTKINVPTTILSRTIATISNSPYKKASLAAASIAAEEGEGSAFSPAATASASAVPASIFSFDPIHKNTHGMTFVLPVLRFLGKCLHTFLTADAQSPSCFVASPSSTSSIAPSLRRTLMLERLLMVCPPFHNASVVPFKSTSLLSPTTAHHVDPHHQLNAQILHNCLVANSLSIHDWVEMPLRALVTLAQVKDQLWKRDYFEVQRQADIYDDFQPHNVKEMDLFVLQTMSAIVGPNNLAAQLLARFSYVPQIDRHVVTQAPLGYAHFLDLVLTLVGDDTQTCCNPRKSNTNRIVRTMATQGPMIHSQLMENINRQLEEDDDEQAEAHEQAEAIQRLIIALTTSEQQRKGTVRKLKKDPQLWNNLSIYNPLWDINDRESALNEYNILFQKNRHTNNDDNGSATNGEKKETASAAPARSAEEFPRAIVGEHHEALVDSLRGLLHTTPTLTTAIFAVLHRCAEMERGVEVATANNNKQPVEKTQYEKEKEAEDAEKLRGASKSNGKKKTAANNNNNTTSPQERLRQMLEALQRQQAGERQSQNNNNNDDNAGDDDDADAEAFVAGDDDDEWMMVDADEEFEENDEYLSGEEEDAEAESDDDDDEPVDMNQVVVETDSPNLGAAAAAADDEGEEDEESPSMSQQQREESAVSVASTLKDARCAGAKKRGGGGAASQPRSSGSSGNKNDSKGGEAIIKQHKKNGPAPIPHFKVSDTMLLSAIDCLLLSIEDAIEIAKAEKEEAAALKKSSCGGNATDGNANGEMFLSAAAMDEQDNSNGAVNFAFFEQWHQRTFYGMNPYNVNITPAADTATSASLSSATTTATTSSSAFNSDFFVPLPELAGRSPYIHALAKIKVSHSKVLTQKNNVPTALTQRQLASPLYNPQRHLPRIQQQKEEMTAQFNTAKSLMDVLPILEKYFSMELESKYASSPSCSSNLLTAHQLSCVSALKNSFSRPIAEVYLAKVRRLMELIANEPKSALNDGGADKSAAEKSEQEAADAKAAADRAARIKEKQQLLMARMKKKQEKASEVHRIAATAAAASTAVAPASSGEEGAAASDNSKGESSSGGAESKKKKAVNAHETLMLGATEVECCFCRLADDDSAGGLMWLAHASASSNVADLRSNRGNVARFTSKFTAPNPSTKDIATLRSTTDGAGNNGDDDEDNEDWDEFANAGENDDVDAKTRANNKKKYANKFEKVCDGNNTIAFQKEMADLKKRREAFSSLSAASNNVILANRAKNESFRAESEPSIVTAANKDSNSDDGDIVTNYDRLSVSIMTCGHAAHLACVEKHHIYLNQQRGRDIRDLHMSRRGFRGMHFLGGAEFCCPICTKVATVLCCMPKLTNAISTTTTTTTAASATAASSSPPTPLPLPLATPGTLVEGSFAEWVSASAVSSAGQTRAFKALVSETVMGFSRSAECSAMDDRRVDAWMKMVNIASLLAVESMASSAASSSSGGGGGSAVSSSAIVSKLPADYLFNLMNFGWAMSDNVLLFLEGRLKISQDHSSSAGGASAPTDIQPAALANLATILTTIAVSLYDDDGSVLFAAQQQQPQQQQPNQFDNTPTLDVAPEVIAVFSKILELSVLQRTLESVAKEREDLKRARITQNLANQTSSVAPAAASASSSSPLSPFAIGGYITQVLGGILNKKTTPASATAEAPHNSATAESSSAATAPAAASTSAPQFRFDAAKEERLAYLALPQLALTDLYALLTSFTFAAAIENAKAFVSAVSTAGPLSCTASEAVSAAIASFMEIAVSDLTAESTFAPFVLSTLSSATALLEGGGEQQSNNTTTANNIDSAVATAWNSLVQLSLFKHLLTGTLPPPCAVGCVNASSNHHHHDEEKKKQQAVPCGAYLLPLGNPKKTNAHVSTATPTSTTTSPTTTNTDDANNSGLLSRESAIAFSKIKALLQHLCPEAARAVFGDSETAASESSESSATNVADAFAAVKKTLISTPATATPHRPLVAIAAEFLKLSSSSVRNNERPHSHASSAIEDNSDNDNAVIVDGSADNQQQQQLSRCVIPAPIVAERVTGSELTIVDTTLLRCRDFVFLPHTYHTYVQQMATLKHCSQCGATNPSFMCLKCRGVFCLRGVSAGPEVFRHSQTCGGGVGVLMMLRSSDYVIVSTVAERAFQNRPVYVDRYGEYDEQLRRGVALHLHQTYIASDLLTPLITNTWDHDPASLNKAFRHGVTRL